MGGTEGQESGVYTSDNHLKVLLQTPCCSGCTVHLTLQSYLVEPALEVFWTHQWVAFFRSSGATICMRSRCLQSASHASEAGKFCVPPIAQRFQSQMSGCIL